MDETKALLLKAFPRVTEMVFLLQGLTSSAHKALTSTHLIVAVHPLSDVGLFATPMNCSTPGLPVLHCLLDFAQTHVHGVSDAIQPSHPLSPPSPALNLSQHQGLFQ